MTKPHPAREAIIALHRAGHQPVKIVELLQNFPDKVDAPLVSKTIKRYEELGTSKDRSGRGRKKKLDEALAKKKIEDLLRRKKRYPKVSTRIVATKLHISQRTAECLIKGKSFRDIELIKCNFRKAREEVPTPSSRAAPNTGPEEAKDGLLQSAPEAIQGSEGSQAAGLLR